LSAPPLLSIGVPVYNGERHLAEALESALAQDYPNLEVVIADSASTDSTPEICRRFEADSRVRYMRNRERTDLITGHREVVEMARGTYFTWLAHDDVLTSPQFGSTLVEVLEANPDAVLCASHMELLRESDPQARSVLTYTSFASERPWRQVRRELFRWPPDDWDTLTYGVFRRAALERHFSENPSAQFTLQRLAFAGRFIVVPPALRAFRLHEESDSRRLVAKSELELLRMGFAYKWRLLKIAARSPVEPRERLSLVGVALRNFLGSQVAWAHSIGQQIRALEEELDTLAHAAKERKALILRNGGRPTQDAVVVPAHRHRRRSAYWLRRANQDDIDRLAQLTARVADARRVCDELLATLEGESAREPVR
jgi:glycosyltransferase involved in cell wall biosynthesis